MSRIASGKHFGSELCDLWGLKNCTDIKIHIPYNGIVKITAEFNATIEQGESLKTLIKKCWLEEIVEKEKCTCDTCAFEDVVMRNAPDPEFPCSDCLNQNMYKERKVGNEGRS